MTSSVGEASGQRVDSGPEGRWGEGRAREGKSARQREDGGAGQSRRPAAALRISASSSPPRSLSSPSMTPPSSPGESYRT